MRFLRRVYRRNDDADLYHVNWLQNILPMPANAKPLLVTVLGTDMQLLRLPGMRALLRRVFRNHPTVVCPNADWMVAPLQDAFGEVASIEFLPFGIDPGWFRVARNLQRAPARWIAVTRLTRGKLGPLFPWCAPLFADGDRELHLFGPMQEGIDLPAWVHYHGPASPDTLRDDWFPIATGLITLSQHAEGRPQVMLEAMAAGLPILASDLPAHSSFLRHDETGWLCASPGTLANDIAALEDVASNARIGEAARAWAMREVGTWDDCAERYFQIYKRLMGQPAR
jgi:glycosyltransferase involved in cell wall biosynthesis